MDLSQLEEICHEIQALHKAMKNITQIVFATSPLLALSTYGWANKAIHRTYLLRVSYVLTFSLNLLTIIKVFVALGNNCPQILVELEDRILEAIIAISEGKSSETAVDILYSELLLLEKDLSNDDNTMNWFNLFTTYFSMPSTPPPSVFPSTPSTYLGQDSPPEPHLIPDGSSKALQTGLASPPQSRVNTPYLTELSKSLHIENSSLLRCIDPKALFLIEDWG